MKVELVTSTKGEGKYSELNEEQIISAIARHGVIKEDNGKLVKYLMDNAHWSPLDMVDFGFEIETTRAIGRQWLRHASLKPQEHSQRYSESCHFEDFEIRLEHPTNRQSSTEVVMLIHGEDGTWVANEEYEEYAIKVSELLEDIQLIYQEGIELGFAKETLRNILPECTTTVLTFKGSVRSWLSFLNVRLDYHAQKEIRELAELVGLELEKKLPNVFKRIDWKNGMFM